MKTAMSANPRHTLICTVGTSLFGNLSKLKPNDPDEVRSGLAVAHDERDWSRVALLLRRVDSADRLCGAEINSVSDLLANGYVTRLHLHQMVSDTPEGRSIGRVLTSYFEAEGWRTSCTTIEGLRDDSPREFRTRGLRNLVKEIGGCVRNAGGAEFCAIDATGGYKAQIAIAVLMGQALGIPVYYKHERFSIIIPFPPMPVAWDSSLWERASGMFMALGERYAVGSQAEFEEDWDERFEPLIDREEDDGDFLIALSPTGQIFHETFRARFRGFKEGRLPQDAKPSEKRDPILRDHSWGQAEAPIRRHMKRLTEMVPYVTRCKSTYWNPDLPRQSLFRRKGGKIEGVYSNGSWCVKFRVCTTAHDDHDIDVIVADLNEWLHDAGG